MEASVGVSEDTKISQSKDVCSLWNLPRNILLVTSMAGPHSDTAKGEEVLHSWGDSTSQHPSSLVNSHFRGLAAIAQLILLPIDIFPGSSS